MEECFLYNTCNHIDCDKFCLRKYKTEYLYNEANIPIARRGYEPLFVDKNGNDNDAFKLLKQIESNIIEIISTGASVYIHSAICGNGKTSWALRFIKAYINEIWFSSSLECKALFISVPDFFLKLKADISNRNEFVQQVKENINKVDIVVWDDIGTKTITSFEAENLFSMIDTRINLGKTNIFTSNLNDSELQEVLGDRLTSRVVNSTYNIELLGADKRGLKL